MFLKIFTAFTIILISKTYGNLDNQQGLYVIVDGYPWWNDGNVNNVNAVLANAGTKLSSNENIQNHSSIYLTGYVSTKNPLDGLTVTFNYNLEGQVKELIKKIPDSCIDSESKAEKRSSETVDSKDQDYNCHLGDVRLDGN
uniref:Uncharacterized protein n=1 Tax=Strongyloides papillosus TaxID=174720 RepID=A0A0N5BCE2_STREA